MRQGLMNARNERDDNMDEILSSLLTQDKILAKKILDYILDNQPNGYQKLFNTPSVLFTEEDLGKGLIQSFLGNLNKFANNIEDERKEIYNVISQLRNKYNDILDDEILEQEKQLALLKEKKLKNNCKVVCEVEKNKIDTYFREEVNVNEMIKSKLLSNEELEAINYFKNHEGKSEEDSYEYFMGLNKRSIEKLKLISKGGQIHGLDKTISLCGWDIKYRMHSPRRFQEFICWLFGKEYQTKEELSEQEVVDYFKNHKGKSEEKSYEYFMGLSQKEVLSLDLKGRKITQIMALTQWINDDDYFRHTLAAFQDFILYIHDKNLKNEIVTYIKTYNNMSEEESYGYFMRLSRDEIISKSFSYMGYSMTKIFYILLGKPIKGQQITKSEFQILIKAVYDKGGTPYFTGYQTLGKHTNSEQQIEADSVKRATKIELQLLWINNELECTRIGGKWGEYSRDWNNRNSKTKGFKLPTSLTGLSSSLGIVSGKRKDIIYELEKKD